MGVLEAIVNVGGTKRVRNSDRNYGIESPTTRKLSLMDTVEGNLGGSRY